MPDISLPKPTEAELSILRVLWQRGPSTVRAVVERLNEVQETGYTTGLKLMQIMFEKGLLTRDERQRTHVYSPTVSREQTQRQLIRDLARRAFDGSAQKLVIQALSTRKASPSELKEIRKLLDQIEEHK
jgi:predicted transcriptional regulator